jgi:hypothetical protein
MELAIMTRALKCADYATLQDSRETETEQQKRKKGNSEHPERGLHQ